ncbi:DUF5348 domain-containing protein [Clostridium weizhouense]|uniref:DUF5348 domain-containing protein n=1 Tax=Clostridium weizhouense TaxID=2859781 RepID=A0ABS7AL16_9CLOT|nr:DUF5348 domain-containing protein [Clostridium weizhouense]MBW6408793.1 DUF5348 domain-containing protein [Clostridium weizhouense]
MKSGILKHNKSGRYEIDNSVYFTSGDSIEIFKDNEWIKGRIEYSHDELDYYFINESKGLYIYFLTGLKARCN